MPNIVEEKLLFRVSTGLFDGFRAFDSLQQIYGVSSKQQTQLNQLCLLVLVDFLCG